MRLWSIHPMYLDVKGLTSAWREALLAKKVLEGQTTGYKNHPQLNRFKTSYDPISSINYYLTHLYIESVRRDYKYDKSKIGYMEHVLPIFVNDGQVEYEFNFLQDKLFKRDIYKWELNESMRSTGIIVLHPLFQRKLGEIEIWERVK